MIDYDYDVLYQLIKDIENEKFPTLTLFVPTLPENSFSAEIWNPDIETPFVAIRCDYSSEVPIYNANGEEIILDFHQFGITD